MTEQKSDQTSGLRTTESERQRVGDLESMSELLRGFARESGERFGLAQDAAGRLVIISPDGQRTSYPGTEALVQALAGRLDAFADELRMAQVDIDRLIRGLEHQLDDRNEWSNLVFRLDRQLADIVPREGSLTWRKTGDQNEHFGTRYDPGKIGRGLEHLPPLPGEDYLFANDSRRLTEVARVDSDAVDPRGDATRDGLGLADVGKGIAHLPPMPDGSRRITGDETRINPFAETARFRNFDSSSPAQQPRAESDSYRMAEDGRLAGRLFNNDFLPNGARDLKVAVAPHVGIVVLGDDGTFTYTPPLHFSGDVVFSYSFTDPRTGLTVRADARINVVPVADSPVVTVSARPVITDEDRPVLITGLGGALVDKDGSETLLYRLENVPEGASFGGRGIYLGGGIWQFSPAELETPLTLAPPLNWHGSVDLALVGVAREMANGGQAETRRIFNVTVEAEADAPVLATGTTRFNEDVPKAFGQDIAYELADRDGSEMITRIELSGIPANVTVTYVAASGATVTRIGQLWRIEGEQAAIRATLDSFTAQRPVHGDADFQISVAVTSRDADGSVSATTGIHRLVTDAVADAPTIAGNANGIEDTVFAVPVTVNLVDQDGSERLAFVDVSGVPAGALLGWNGLLAGSVTNLGAGSFRFTGSTTEIQALLASLTIRPPANSDVDFALTVTAVSEECNPSEPGGVALLKATTVATIPVTVAAAADTPSLVATTTTGNEDSPIAFGAGITFAVTDLDGSEVISKLRVAGVPTGAVIGWNNLLPGTLTNLGGGIYEITGSEAEIRTLAATLTLTPPANSDVDFTLTHTVTARDNDGSSANRSTTQDVIVTAVADAPTASAGPGNFNILEDTPTALPGLGGALTDLDGSETHLFRISGIPVGSVFNSGINLGGGIWQFTPAQMTAGLIFTPPLNFSAVINAMLHSISTEIANGSSSTTSLPLVLTVGDVADPPTVNTTSSTGTEDSAILVGANITYALTDTDGSEVISRVQITGIPVGAIVAYTVAGTATVTAVAGGYRIDGPQADIRTTLDSLRLQPPANADGNIVLTVAVTSKETDGTTATTTATHNVIVNAAADVPVVAGATTGNEDSVIVVPISVSLSDTDGSETLAFVQVSGVPTGGVLGWNGVLPGTVNNLGGGVFRFTGTTAQIQALLGSLTITPPANSDVDFNLTVLARATESAPSEVGEVALLNRDTTFTVPVTVNDVADLPTLSAASTTGNEDSPISFGADITYSLADTDGSETITRVTLAGVPAGSGIVYSLSGAANVAYDGTTYTITGTPAEIRATLSSFSVTPPLNTDADFTLTTSVTSTDTGGVTATRSGTHGIVVNPVSDTPNLSASTVSGEEDTFINFGSQVIWVKPDNDSSERISRVEITGFGSSTAQYTALGGATVTAIAGGFSITAPTEAAIRQTLDTFSVRQALNFDSDITLTTRAQTIDGVAVASSYGSVTQTIIVDAQADAPTVNVAAISGNEDTSITFGDKITWLKPDNDGTEWVSRVTLTGFPVGWTVTYTPNAAVTVTGDAQTGYVLSITAQGNEGLLRNLLNTVSVTPPLNADADFTIQAVATTTDADGSTAPSAAVNVPIVVNAVADAPSASALNVTGAEDTAIPLTLATGGSSDTDGSETLTMRVTGVPSGASFNRGANSGGGVWTFSASDIAAGVTFTPPAQYSGPVNMVLVSRSTEISNGNFSETSSPFTVTVTPVLDLIDVTNTTQTVNEDVLISAGALFGISLADVDGSQSLTYRVSGIPAGYTVGRVLTGATTYTDLGGGVVEFSGPNAAHVITSIRTMTLTAAGVALHKDVNFTLTIDATTVETGGATSTDSATHAVTVRAVADQPSISASNPTLNEDPASPIPFAVTVSLVDTDGSEVLNQVDVTFTIFTGTIPTLNWNTGLPGTVTGIANGHRFTGTTAQVQALLASLTVTPQANNGTDIGIRVVAQAQETNPTEVGDVATLTATRTSNFTINMVPVADQPTVTAPGIGTPFNTEEDTAVTLTGLGGSLVDTDLSEVLTYRILNVPIGANFGGVGSNLGGGIWQFTKAQVDAGLNFTPPSGFSGTVDMTLRAIATETENSVTSTNDAVFRVIVDPQADAPNVTGATTINEDVATTIGSNIAIALTDTDGSEYISQVVISGFPAGAVVAFGTSDPAVTVTGTGIGPFTLSITAQGDAAKLRAVLDSLRLTAPGNSDTNFNLTVQATSKDLDGSTAPTSATHVVTVRAVADTPGVTAPDFNGTEDVISVSLGLVANLNDLDGSETLSARILDVPAGSVLTANTAGGGTFTNNGNGTYSITAPSAAQLGTILASIAYTPVAHSSNSVTMRLEVTATEAATGGEVATKTSVVTDPFTVNLTAVADAPTLKVVAATGGNSGFEDTAIPLGITGELTDKDGSEVLSLGISNVPLGAVFVNGLGASVGTNSGGGNWTFSAAQISDLRIVPPPNSNADFTLSVTLTATEMVPGNPGNGSTSSVTLALPVNVIGVADTPNLTVSVVNSPEDMTIPLGASIVGSLADNDGSEVLYYVISGLPAGVLPSVGTYIGGEWQIAAADMPLLTIPSPPQFSGNYTATYAPALSVRAVAQEDDGNQTSVTRALQVNITAVMDAFPGWTPSVQVTEDNDIPLANAAGGITLVDNDGSERVVSYTFNLNGVIAAAGIGASVPNVANLIANHITGTFTDNGNGTITVLAANLAGVAFRAVAFRDSNIDFTIPVTTQVSETGGLTQNVSGTFSINLVGDADVPTAYAQNVTGLTGQLVRLNPNSPTGHNFGGDITDTDAAAGRVNSERIYYIVSGMDSVPGLEVAFFNSAGALIGLNNNDGTWYLTKADLADLHIVSRFGQTGSITLTLTSVTEENDGDIAVASTPATMTATFMPDAGAGGNINPLTPIISITPMTGNEDGTVNFTVNVNPDPADPSPITPTVVLLISGLPTGAQIIGATLNPNTGRYIATAADLAAGNVRIVPPQNLSGTMNITVEAIATNTQLNKATTGPQTVTVTLTPVADGPNITANPASGTEDVAANLNLSVTLLDTDAASPETLNSPIRVTVTNGATLSAGTLVSPGVYDLTLGQLAGLQLIPASNLHGSVTVTVQATSREPGNNDMRTTTSNFTVNFAASADAPIATANNVSGNEDGVIALTGLSAVLVDTDGSERLSVKIIGIPDGSILSAGANNGDGSWTISPSDLASLTIKPPKDYSGVMALELRAFALDANGNTSTTIVPFTVTVAPLADAANLNAVNVSGAEDTAVALSLGLAMGDTTGVLAGENPAELVELTFDGVLIGSTLQSTGGTLVQLAPDQWRFTGTTAQAATLAYRGALNMAGDDDITVSAVALDGASRGVVSVDTFKVTLAGVADAPTITDFSIGTPGSNSIAINVAASFPDMDGSESHAYTISGVTGGSFNAGTDLGGGVWQFTGAQIAGLAYVPGPGGGLVNLTLEARATETVGGSTVATTSTLSFIAGNSGANALVGTAGADCILGLDGNDSITGGPGIDTLTGGAGADQFIWAPAHTASGPDQITDFNTGQGDALNISALLTGFTPGITPITNFVRLIENAGNTRVEIDPSGGNNFIVSLAILQGVTGLNAETMRLSGNIIA